MPEIQIKPKFWKRRKGTCKERGGKKKKEKKEQTTCEPTVLNCPQNFGIVIQCLFHEQSTSFFRHTGTQHQLKGSRNKMTSV